MQLKPEMSFFWLPLFPADTNNSQDDVDWGSGTESAYEDISEDGDDFWLGDTDLDGIGEGPSDDIMTFRREFVPASFWKELSLRRHPPRNATFYQKHSTFPVYEDCSTTLAQMAMKFMVDLVAVKRRTADSLCSSIKEALPSPNIFPPSIHLLKKVAGVECAFRYAHHVCPNDCMVWPWLPPRSWHDHRQDACTVCGQKRFVFDGASRALVQEMSDMDKAGSTGSALRLRPAKVFFYFGVATGIKSLFSDSEFRANRGKDRAATSVDPNAVFGCSEGRRLTERTRGSFSHPDNSPYDLGFDFGQFFSFKNHSFGVVLLRCADLPPDMISKEKFSRVVFVIPGPNEPKSIDAYLGMVIQEFRRYGPATRSHRDGKPQQLPGLQIDVNDRDGQFRHVIFLARVYADTPARQKLTKGAGHSSYFPCWWCKFKGRRVAAGALKRGIVEDVNGSMRQASWGMVDDEDAEDVDAEGRTAGVIKYFGYLKAQRQELLDGRAVHAWDDELLRSHQDQVQRGHIVDREPSRHKLECCHGSCLFSKLEYVDLNHLFIVPVCHSLLYGVAKDFLKAFFGGLLPALEWNCSSNAKRVMSRRAEDIILTSEFNRPYRDVVKFHASWTMEEYMTFILTVWEFIFRPYRNKKGAIRHVLHEIPREAWAYLVVAARHYLVSSYSEAPERASCQAQAALRNYAKIAEKHFPMLCTSNLHMLVCRLPRQERAWGHVSKDLEMWVERGVQTVKSGFRQGIHTECPELCHANRLAARCGLHSEQEGSAEGAVVNAAPSGSIPDALRHLRRAQQGVMTGVDRVGTASKASDHPYCSTTVCMIGKGKPVEEHKRQTLSIAIERSVADGLLDGSYLELVRCSGARVRVFQQAVMTTRTEANVLSSMSYRRCEAR